MKYPITEYEYKKRSEDTNWWFQLGIGVGSNRLHRLLYKLYGQTDWFKNIDWFLVDKERERLQNVKKSK